MYDAKVILSGESPSAQTSDLQKWLVKDRSVDLGAISQDALPPSKEEMGAELLPILTIALASPVLVELVKSIFGWLQANRGKNQVTIETAHGKFSFDASQADKVAEIIEKLK